MSLNKLLLAEITKNLQKATKFKRPKNQWQDPGEITEVNSRNITMRGVNYPVLGVGADGYTQMMQPNMDYEFPQGPVVEYPMMQKGGIIPKAQVGKTVNKIISNLNPFNFLVNDYTDKGDFNKAYRAAREQGEKEFLWNNKRYTTNYNGTLKEQLDQTGIIDVNKSKNTALRHQLIEGTYTGDAYDQYKYKDIIKDVLNPNKNVRNPYTDGVEKDLLRIYLGRPTKHNLVTLSKYKPTIAKGDKENLYYSIKDYGEFLNPSLNSLKKDEGFNTLKEYAQYLNDNKGSGKINEQPYDVGLGDHTINYGKDDRGEYISYYDKWDLNPYAVGKNAIDISMGYAKPFDVYDRIYYKNYGDDTKRLYYTDEELSKLDVNKKNFDTLALQRELSNRGYKLPKSTNKYGYLDGILGNETKNALQTWQTKNKSYSQGGQFQDGGILDLFKGRFSKFKNTLPPNLRYTPNRDYDMRYYWKHSGKPQNFEAAQAMDQPMFSLEEDGYHAPSVEPITGRFLKPKHHSTLYKELEWYNSEDPNAVNFRKTHDLNTTGKYYRYVPKKEMAMGGSLLGALTAETMYDSKKQGGEMIRRADGSYSRRGLWDNIRANKGSGKKPTKQMLEQERKIKAQEKQFGGQLLNDLDMYNYYNPMMDYMATGGEPQNAGFQALPDYVQNKIMANMAYGGYIPEMMHGGFYMQDGGEPDGEMAIGQIEAALDKLMTLRKFIQPDSDLEPWVSSKLTLMDHYADAVADYMQYNPEAQESKDEEEMMMMAQGGGIPQRYKNMGFNKVGVKKKSTRPGKKWMVLAKKGDQYKVVHGGYKGMQDFTQHRNEGRRKNFWNRMGGKSSSKATDPFSPLYWHKRFGTWENGGEVDDAYFASGGYVGYDGKHHMSNTPTWSGNVGYQGGGEIDEDAILMYEALGQLPDASLFQYGMGGTPCYECGGSYAYGGIHINPANKGKFTASAQRAGMGVQEFAQHVMANKEDYSPTQVKRANFARNAAKWKKQDGGPMVGDEMDVTPEQLEYLRQMGYEFEII